MFRQKWKNSTARTNVDRIRYHLSVFKDRPLRGMLRKELQELLGDKGREGLSFSVIAHLRWDLKQIFDLALAEGRVDRNPAVLLFTPPNARRIEKRQLNWQEVQNLLLGLRLRERLIVSLALIVGMRPGEIFALQWRHYRGSSITVDQRVYRGEIDTPKTVKSVREVALSRGVQSLMEQ